MKSAIAATGAAAVLLTAGAALANGEAEQCFDKGTLTYFDCPTAEVVETGNFYIGARGGLAFVEDVEYDLTEEDKGDPAPAITAIIAILEPTVFGVSAEHETGYVVTGMVGYEFVDVQPGMTLRPELEIGALTAEVDTITAEGEGTFSAGGDTSVLFGFVNLFADFEVAESVDLIVGGGVGLGHVDLDKHSIDEGVLVDDSATAFGYNIGAGLGVEVEEGVKLEAMYRYMSFIDAELETEFGAGGTDEVDVNAHTATVGIRFDL